jgi:hypothetical protein
MDKTFDDTLRGLEDLDGEQRYKYLIQTAVENDQLWILSDDQGVVMLNDDEDGACVPVWPHEETAKVWATGHWRHCQAEAIPLKKWLNDWTPGLMDDDLSVVVFPNEQAEGMVIYPDELDFALRRKLK